MLTYSNNTISESFQIYSDFIFKSFDYLVVDNKKNLTVEEAEDIKDYKSKETDIKDGVSSIGSITINNGISCVVVRVAVDRSLIGKSFIVFSMYLTPWDLVLLIILILLPIVAIILCCVCCCCCCNRQKKMPEGNIGPLIDVNQQYQNAYNYQAFPSNQVFRP